MKETIDMLFALLRSVLCAEKLDKSNFKDFDGEKIELLYKVSKKHDMAHIVGVALNNAGLLNDSDLAGKFTKQQLLAVYRCENFEYELKRICDVFEKAQIPHIPLKGSVIRTLYPEPWMRTSCDIDVLVHEEDIDQAIQALVDVGYRAEDNWNYHDISLHSESGVHLELHFSIKENIKELDAVLSGVWEYAHPLMDSVRYELSPEFVVFYTVAHMSYHFVSGGCGIRPFADLWYINKKLDYDEKKVIELCRQCELLDFYYAVKMLVDVWYSGKEHNELTLRMEQFIIVGGVYGAQEQHIAIQQSKKGSKLEHIRSILFPKYEKLKMIYPTIKSRAQMPIYQVRHWIDVIKDRDRTKKSIKRLKTSVSLESDKVDEVGRLINDLNLNKYTK